LLNEKWKSIMSHLPKNLESRFVIILRLTSLSLTPATQKAKLGKLGRVVRDLLATEPASTRRALEARGIEDLEAFLTSSGLLNDFDAAAYSFDTYYATRRSRSRCASGNLA
jgi:hypothetical protein